MPGAGIILLDSQTISQIKRLDKYEWSTSLSCPEITPDFSDAEANASPIVIDLNGDGIKTTTLAESYTQFDLNNNQFAEKTAWVDKNDGLLALDLNGNGRIDNGSELFGN